MNQIIQILDLEIELEIIRDRKKASIKAMKYGVAREYKDLEKLKENEIHSLATNLQKILDEILSASTSIQILDLEIELKNIRDRKSASIKAMKYEVACEYRDLEKLKENEIFTLVTNLQKTLDETQPVPNNYYELKDLRRAILYYQNNKNFH